MPAAPAVLTALTQAAVKRRFFTRATAARLIQGAVDAGVAGADGLRAWLARADVVHPDLGKKLTALIAPGEGLPFGPYRALAHLADGGMGSVWLAERPGAEGLLVVKTLRPGVAGPTVEESLRRFEREARITRQLAHPNVVRCVDSGLADKDTLFLALEYVDSGDLRDLVEATGGLAEALALAILLQATEGLAEAHRLRLIHRDIKPGNIFVGSNGQTKLADFGIARSTASDRTMLTMEGAIIGSPQYMSPEQIRSPTEVDIRSDLYALGAVLHFCLAEEPPFTGKLQEVLHQHVTTPVPDVRRRRPEVSAATQGIIARCMAKAPAERYQDPGQLRTAVTAALTGLGVSVAASPDSTPNLVRDAAARLGNGQAAMTLGTRVTVSDLPTVASDAPANRTGQPEQPTLVENLNQPAGGTEPPTLTVDLSPLGGLMATLPMGERPNPPARPLAGGEMPTITADLNQVPAGGEMPTITADLNQVDGLAATIPTGAPVSADPSAPISEDVAAIAAAMGLTPVANPRAAELATMTAILLAEARHQASEPGTGATVIAALASPQSRPAQVLSLTGDLLTAMDHPWIALVPPAGAPVGSQALVLLYGKPRISFGKLRDATVDLCLRNYPIAEHKESCQRISRVHGHLSHHPESGQCHVEDATAANGTRLDGVTIPPGSRAAVADDAECVLDVAGAVVLRLRSFPRRGAALATPVGFIPGPVGLDASAAADVLTITRPENRPELAAALVLRRLTLGGPGSDLPLAGARTRSSVEIALVGGRWIHRPVAPANEPAGPWAPLQAGGEVACGGLRLIAQPANHELYA